MNKVTGQVSHLDEFVDSATGSNKLVRKHVWVENPELFLLLSYSVNFQHTPWFHISLSKNNRFRTILVGLRRVGVHRSDTLVKIGGRINYTFLAPFYRVSESNTRGFYRPQRSWGKVIFSEECLKNSVHRGGGMHGRGVCMAGVACMAGGACVVGGMCCREGVCVAGGCAWWGGMGGGGCVWQGGMHGIPSMSGWYTSYWNAFLFRNAKS